MMIAGGVALTLTLGVACGGGGADSTPTDTTPAGATTEDTVLVKNRPLNNCVSIISGERPQTSEALEALRNAQQSCVSPPSTARPRAARP